MSAKDTLRGICAKDDKEETSPILKVVRLIRSAPTEIPVLDAIVDVNVADACRVGFATNIVIPMRIAPRQPP
jgi:hypothetical protein